MAKERSETRRENGREKNRRKREERREAARQPCGCDGSGWKTREKSDGTEYLIKCSCNKS